MYILHLKEFCFAKNLQLMVSLRVSQKPVSRDIAVQHRQKCQLFGKIRHLLSI